MENGKHSAVSNSASVYAKDGKLLCAMEFLVGEANEPLKKYFVLVKADGQANERELAGIREWSGWDGIDPYWLQDNAGAQWPVEVVVEWEPGFKDPSKSFPSIQWVNAVGGGVAGLPASSDRAAVLAQFGAKLRAVAGPKAMPGARHTPVKQASAGAPPVRAAAPVRTPPPVVVKHTNTSCWEALVKGKPSASQAELEGLWYSVVTGDQSTMTPADWAKVAEAIERLSDPSTREEEPMPF